MLTCDKPFYSKLDKLALRTWPAALQETDGPWVLRASGGVTKRANSVWTADGSGAWEPNAANLACFERAKTFYKEHRLPLRFHISDASPDGLDEWLAAQGFEMEIPCDFMISDAEETLRQTAARPVPGSGFSRVIESRPGDPWLDHFLQLEGFSEKSRSFYEGMFQRLEPSSAFIRLMDGARCAALATAVAEDGWAGFTNVVVHPELRGQGLGRGLLHALAEWSLEAGASHLFLQVISDNVPAVKLYGKAGFRKLFGYHYRVQGEAR